MAFNEKAWHVGFKWTIGDENNPTGAICLDDSSDALHICEIADARTDWNVSTTSHPTLYVHSATTPSTDYMSMYHDGDYAYLGVDGTTLLTMTTAGIDVTGNFGITGDVEVTGGLTWTGDMYIANTYGLTVGAESQQTISDGGGTTDVIPEVQVQGTAQVDSTVLIGQWSVTNASGPMLAFLKSGNAAIGSKTAVAENEYLGRIVAFGDDATDYESAAAEIRFVGDGTVATGYMPGAIEFFTTPASSETLTLALTIDKASHVTFVGDIIVDATTASTSTTTGSIQTDGGLGVAGATYIGGTLVVNDAGADIDTRIESSNLEYALFVDGGKDCVVIGDNTDKSDVDVRLWVGNVAKTLATGQSAAILHVAPTADTTEFTSGTHGYITTAYFKEPRIGHAASGTITTAATVYIADAPTEGDTNNAALFVASGNTILAGTLYLYDTGGESIASNGSTLTIDGDAIALTGPTTVTGGAFTMGASGSPAGDFILWPTTALYKVWLDVDGDTNGAWYFGADDYGIDVSFYGQTASTSMIWDASAGYLLFAGAGRLEVGTFAAPISLDTFTGNEDIHGAMVSSVINAAMTAGEVSRNVWSRMKITADQTANVSVYGACLQLRAHTGDQTVELGAGLFAGAWLYYEGSDSGNILTISGGEHCAAAATVELSSAQLVTGGSIYGIKINSAVHGDVSVASADSFSALYINAGSGKEPWTTGIEMVANHVVTGITLNAATTGLVITGTYATATSKAINSAITVDVPNYTDGLGANNFDLTTTGVMAGHSAATSSWININGTIASGGVIVAAQTNGIWVNTGGSGNITNAIAVIGMRMSAITTTNASKLTCFSVNVSGDVLDGIFHVAAGENNLGEVANAGTALSFLVPLYINDAGVKKYVKLYDLQ